MQGAHDKESSVFLRETSPLSCSSGRADVRGGDHELQALRSLLRLRGDEQSVLAPGLSDDAGIDGLRLAPGRRPAGLLEVAGEGARRTVGEVELEVEAVRVLERLLDGDVVDAAVEVLHADRQPAVVLVEAEELLRDRVLARTAGDEVLVRDEVRLVLELVVHLDDDHAIVHRIDDHGLVADAVERDETAVDAEQNVLRAVRAIEARHVVADERGLRARVVSLHVESALADLVDDVRVVERRERRRLGEHVVTPDRREHHDLRTVRDLEERGHLVLELAGRQHDRAVVLGVHGQADLTADLGLRDRVCDLVEAVGLRSEARKRGLLHEQYLFCTAPTHKKGV